MNSRKRNATNMKPHRAETGLSGFLRGDLNAKQSGEVKWERRAIRLTAFAGLMSGERLLLVISERKSFGVVDRLRFRLWFLSNYDGHIVVLAVIAQEN